MPDVWPSKATVTRLGDAVAERESDADRRAEAVRLLAELFTRVPRPVSTWLVRLEDSVQSHLSVTGRPEYLTLDVAYDKIVPDPGCVHVCDTGCTP